MEQSVYIYNSLSRKKEPLVPLSPNQIKMYVCGPTVYDEPHIGHARSAYIFDVIRRYLEYRGFKVIFVRNVTDVDDKIIDKAKKEFPSEDLNTSFKKVAEKYLIAYHKALEALEVERAAGDIAEPKASEYIDKMKEFIQVLIDRKVAYQAGGDVYFDITKAKDYGKLSHQSLDKMEIGTRISPTENKKNPLDFALWKSAKEDEPSWESPWGKGRPGWHIECSVMSSDILGDEFDIHGGGIDLIFPHHENEIAQSEGAGKKFARVWIHHGLLTMNGQKMAKSLGNFITVKDVLRKYHEDVLKLFFLQTLYSSPIDYSDKKMEEGTEYYRSFVLLFRNYKENLEKYGEKCLQEEEKKKLDKEYREKFIQAMDDNFNTPVALTVLNRAKSEAYSLTANFALEHNWAKFYYLVKMIEELLLHNFGVFPNKSNPENDDRLLTEHVKQLRETLKKAGKDFKVWKKEQEEQIEQLRREKKYTEADKKKEELRTKGLKVLDLKDGTTEILEY